MDASSYSRDTAFLYPDLATCRLEDRGKILDLISDITVVVENANRKLMELINGGNFLVVNCMPKIYMQCVSEQDDAAKGEDNIRICISKYDNIDYTTNYKWLIEKYKMGKLNISHLVAVDLSPRPRKTQFLADPQNGFNAIISTSIGSLEKVLVAIMFDISLYHFYMLSNTITDRRKFNEIKYNYLSEYLSEDKQEEYYGGRLSGSTPIYLPFSLPKVAEINRCIKEDTRQKAVCDLKKQFATFLTRACSTSVKVDIDGKLISPEMFPTEFAKDVEEWAQRNPEIDKFALVYLQDSTGNRKPYLVKFGDDNLAECWLDNESDDVKDYQNSQIIMIQRVG